MLCMDASWPDLDGWFNPRTEVKLRADPGRSLYMIPVCDIPLVMIMEDIGEGHQEW